MRQRGRHADLRNIPDCAGVQAGAALHRLPRRGILERRTCLGPARFLSSRLGSARAPREIAAGDSVIFATGAHDQAPREHSFDDSNERDDPAYWERINRPMPEQGATR